MEVPAAETGRRAGTYPTFEHQGLCTYPAGHLQRCSSPDAGYPARLKQFGDYTTLHELRERFSLRDFGHFIEVCGAISDPPLFGTTLNDEVELLAGPFGLDIGAIEDEDCRKGLWCARPGGALREMAPLRERGKAGMCQSDFGILVAVFVRGRAKRTSQ